MSTRYKKTQCEYSECNDIHQGKISIQDINTHTKHNHH